MGAEDRVKRFLPFVLTFILLIITPALADITGPARIIYGDTIEIHGQLV